MKATTIATFVVAGSALAAWISFGKTSDIDSHHQAVATATDVSMAAAKLEETEVGQPPLLSSQDTDSVSTEPFVLDAIRKRIESTAAESYPGDASTQLAAVKQQTAAYHELEGFVRPDGIPKSVFLSAVQSAGKSHSDDYTALLSGMKEQLKDYQDLKSFVLPTNVPDDVIRAVALKAVETHPSNVSEQLRLIASQLSAYQKLQELVRPEGMPEDVFKAAVQKAVGMSHPSDFKSLLLVIETDLKAYRDVSTNAASP